MSADRRMDQLYVCISMLEPAPPPLAMSADDISKEHHAYLQDLLDRGILMGSGSAKDTDGKRFAEDGIVAGGVVIIHSDNLKAAEDTANKEPYCREGQRTMKVIPWQRTWFGE